MDATQTETLARLHLWRQRTLIALVPFLAAASAAFLMRGGGLAASLVETVMLVSLLVFGVFAASTVTALYAFAHSVGGERYAFTQAALAAVLAPVFGIGVILIPMLIENDAKKNVTDWQVAERAPLHFSVLETVLVIALFALIFRLPYLFG